MNNKYLSYFIVIMALTGCSVNNQTNQKDILKHQKHGDYQVKNLPLSQSWRTFKCREGNLDARYLDGSHKMIAIRLGRNNESTLSRHLSYDPVIFENASLAFYINDKEAVLGRPASSILMLTGCQPQ